MEKRKLYFATISAILMLTGLTLIFSSYKIFDIVLRHLLDLTPGSLLYEEWVKPPPLMAFDVYVFNWTNPEEFTDKLKKPIVKEVGPFRFDSQVEHRNVTFNPQNDTITYDLRRWYKFNREKSVHDLDVKVTIINQVAAGTAYNVKDQNYFIKKSTSFALSSMSSIEMTKTVNELLFEGTKDRLLDFFRKLPLNGQEIPEKFGYFYKSNGTSDGIFNIGTGRGKYHLGQLYKWNGEEDIKVYDKGCRHLKETVMDFYTDNMNMHKVNLFTPPMCRSFPLDYMGKSTVHGIEGYRFEADDSLLDNGTLVPGNECYCKDQCIGYGAIPAAICRTKSNSYITLPHFLKADPFYTNKIEGMNPDPKIHKFQLIIEPTTGILLKLNARLQMNIYVEPIRHIRMFENAPTILFPIMRFEQSIKIPEDGAFSLGILLSLKGVIICIGAVLSIIGLLIYLLLVFELKTNKRFTIEEVKYSFPQEMNSLRKAQETEKQWKNM